MAEILGVISASNLSVKINVEFDYQNNDAKSALRKIFPTVFFMDDAYNSNMPIFLEQYRKNAVKLLFEYQKNNLVSCNQFNYAYIGHNGELIATGRTEGEVLHNVSSMVESVSILQQMGIMRKMSDEMQTALMPEDLIYDYFKNGYDITRNQVNSGYLTEIQPETKFFIWYQNQRYVALRTPEGMACEHIKSVINETLRPKISIKKDL